ncbi:serine/threonine-protein kinase [Actinomyces trachealis]|uniref:serine/threonine-protein kinase n=1 Tax=Actinomyces trachealis TaxID=2763540 RepID=UPI0018C7F125|nr:serine/threonine-protein kinase [Actinomyces trachealis]
MTSSPGPVGSAAQLPHALRGLREGSVVGGYRLVRRMGAGGMGVVWDATDGGGRHVAIKVLHPQVAADPVSRRRLEREAAVLSRVKDERVARILDIEPAPDGDSPAFVVTELVDGPTLQYEVDHEGPYDPAQDAVELADLAHGLVGALAAVHQAGVIHRDLKPSNVMLGAKGPVLIDFGIAQSEDDTRLTRTGQVTGTPGFIPPEMLDGGQPDAEVDRYACVGVILFALTGQAPFGSGPWQTVFRRVYDGTPELGDLPEKWPALAVAFTNALHPRVDRRMRVEDLLTVLDEVADGGTGEWAVKEILGPDALGVDEEETDTGSFPVVHYAGAGPQASSPGQTDAAYGSTGYSAGSGQPSALADSAAASAPSPAPSTASAQSSGYGVYGNSGVLPPAILPGGQYGSVSTPSPQVLASAGSAGGAWAQQHAAQSVQADPKGAMYGGTPVAHAVPSAPSLPSVVAYYGAGGAPSAFTGAEAVSTPSAQSAAYAQNDRWGVGTTGGYGPGVGALGYAAVGQEALPGVLPEWARGPEKCSGLTAAVGVFLLILALMRPFWVMILVALWEVIAGVVGRADDALRWRRLQQGRTDGDTAGQLLRSPWYLLRSLLAAFFTQLVGLLVAGVCFMLASNWIGFDGEGIPHLTLRQTYSRIALMMVGVTACYMLVTWFVPWGKPTRRGSAIMLGRAVPKGWLRVLVGLVVLMLAVLSTILLAQGYLPPMTLSPLR